MLLPASTLRAGAAQEDNRPTAHDLWGLAPSTSRLFELGVWLQLRTGRGDTKGSDHPHFLNADETSLLVRPHVVQLMLSGAKQESQY